MIDGIQTGGKGMRAPKFIQVGQSLADTLIFTEKSYSSKNNPNM